ncbi:hypothetical protein BU17DRAFT_93869 [Hysterangium stoloniferum]|nr:hypothetical protein BU17DRAFT_93869 [Hysterangium stoloniferum]
MEFGMASGDLEGANRSVAIRQTGNFDDWAAAGSVDVELKQYKTDYASSTSASVSGIGGGDFMFAATAGARGPRSNGILLTASAPVLGPSALRSTAYPHSVSSTTGARGEAGGTGPTTVVAAPHRNTNYTSNLVPNLNPTSSDNNDNISASRHLGKRPFQTLAAAVAIAYLITTPTTIATRTGASVRSIVPAPALRQGRVEVGTGAVDERVVKGTGVTKRCLGMKSWRGTGDRQNHLVCAIKPIPSTAHSTTYTRSPLVLRRWVCLRGLVSKEACVVSKPGSSTSTSSSTIKSEECSEAKLKRAATYDEDDFERNSNLQPTKDLVLLRQVISPQGLLPTSHRRVLGTRGAPPAILSSGLVDSETAKELFDIQWVEATLPINATAAYLPFSDRYTGVALDLENHTLQQLRRMRDHQLFSAARVGTRLMNLRLPDTDGVQEAV